MSTLKSYILGYLLSIGMTLAAFGALMLHIQTHHAFPTHAQLYPFLVVLAVLQLLVQLFFFLHFGREQKTHWRAAVLAFALFAVFVLVGGTLWIMQNLNQHMVQNTYINGQITAQNEND
jgi:cytochrome o ubiquinol oxidase operon protein cyoD